MRKVAIINYGMGNIGSVANALEYLDVDYVVTSSRAGLTGADAIILPGVGSFPAAMENIKELDLAAPLTEQVAEKGKPFLGICLGMQLIAKDSEEQVYSKGLGWIDGNVIALQGSEHLRIPHVGWNDIEFVSQDPLFENIDKGAHFFFDHSFHMKCENSIVSSYCEYGGKIVSSIRMGNIFATQFHPEKSQRSGLKLLRSFLDFAGVHKKGSRVC